MPSRPRIRPCRRPKHILTAFSHRLYFDVLLRLKPWDSGLKRSTSLGVASCLVIVVTVFSLSRIGRSMEDHLLAMPPVARRLPILTDKNCSSTLQFFVRIRSTASWRCLPLSFLQCRHPGGYRNPGSPVCRTPCQRVSGRKRRVR